MAVKKGGKESVTVRQHQTLLAEAKSALPHVVAVSGECEYLRSQAVGQFRDAWLAAYPNGDIATLRGSGEARTSSLVDVNRELSGASLFAKEKLVVLRTAERILFSTSSGSGEGGEETVAAKGKDGEKAFVAALEKPSSTIWLVVEAASIPKNRTLGKKLAEFATTIPCPQPTQREIAPWLTTRSRENGRRIDDAAVDLLLRSYGADLGVLASELDKLVLFAGEGEAIDAEMVGKFLTGTIEFDIFGFTNAVEARNARDAVFYARRIASQGARDQKGKRESADASAHKVLAILAMTLENLLKAKMAAARRADAGEFAQTAGLSPWRAGKLMDASGRFTARELRRMVVYAADQIRRTHDTGGDVMLSLETMAAKFTGGAFRE